MRMCYAAGGIRLITALLLSVISLTKAGDSGCGNEGDIRPLPMSGEMASHPRQGQVVAPQQFCEWVLTPPGDHYVSLTIIDMGNISCHTQLFVYTHLGADRYPGWNLCSRGYFPLDGVPYHVASARGGWLRVHYRGAEGNAPTTGFRAVYKFSEPGCSGTQHLRGAPSWLASHPGAGSWAIEAGSRCSWTLTTTPGGFVALTGGILELHCVAGWQTLEVHDAETPSNDSLIVVLTCTNEVSPIASSGRHLHLSYTDRWASRSLGFNITYRFYETRQSGCGSHFYHTAPFGTISSFQAPGVQTYAPLLRCRWMLRAPRGLQLLLKFERFNVTSRYTEGTCSRDLLVVRQGTPPYTSGVFCNGPSSPPPVIVSSHRQVDLFFATEHLSPEYPQGSGFRLLYSRVCLVPEGKANFHWKSPDENQDGERILTIGETIQFSCNPGFIHVTGNVTGKCEADGTLGTTGITCGAVRCDDIPSPPNTMKTTLDVNMDGHDLVTFGEILNYKCAMGYTAVSGDKRRRCRDDGSWSGEDLRCAVNRCPAPPVIPSTSMVPVDTSENGVETISFGERVFYSCQHGFRKVGGSFLRMCQEDGTYSGEDLVCSPQPCDPVPKCDGAQWTVNDTNGDGVPVVSFQEVVHYSCLAGYNWTAGDRRRVCLPGGRFNGSDIVCTPVACADVPHVENAVASLADTNNDGLARISYLEVAKFTCRPGFSPEGDSVSTCAEDGRFNGSGLKCIKSVTSEGWRATPVTKATMLGAGICLTLVVVLLVILFSLLSYRSRRRQREAARPPSKSQEVASDHTRHVLTLHRVTTPWSRSPGATVNWPMYLWDDPVDLVGGSHLNEAKEATRGSALPITC